MQSEFPCPGICYKPLQTGVCLRCCCGTRIQVLMFQAECFTSGENIPQTEFPTKLALVRVSAAIQVQAYFLLFWHHTSSFDVSRRNSQPEKTYIKLEVLPFCAIFLLSAAIQVSAFTFRHGTKLSPIPTSSQEQSAISPSTATNHRPFYQKQRTFCNQ